MSNTIDKPKKKHKLEKKTLQLREVVFLNQFSLSDYINKKFDIEIEKYNMKI